MRFRDPRPQPYPLEPIPALPDSPENEPGIYSEPGAGDTTVITVIGPARRPVLHAVADNSLLHGQIPPEIQQLYERCMAEFGLRLA